MADAVVYERVRAEIGALRERLRAASSPTAKLEAATILLNRLGVLAANAPTADLQARWLEQYRILQPQVAMLRGTVTNGAPGAVLRSLDAFSDAVLTFSGEVLEGTGGVIAGAGATARALPVLLLVAIVAVAIVLVKVGPQLLGGAKRKGKA
jgi:hypothetical protein